MIEQTRFARFMFAAAIAVEVAGIVIFASCLFLIATIWITPYHGHSPDAPAMVVASGVMTALIFGVPFWHLGRKGRREWRRAKSAPPN